MRRPKTLILITALALTLGVAALATAGVPRRTAPQGFVGVVLDGPMFPTHPGVNLSQQLNVMVASGAESVRVPLNWGTIQPYRNWSAVPQSQRGQYESVDGMPLRLAAVDQLVALCATRGLMVDPVVLNAPDWDARSQSGFVAARTPKSFGPYAMFVKALVHRYGPRGSFWRNHSPKLAIRTWQIWNEPDISGYWAIQPNFETSYVGLLRAAHAAIKSADPQAKLILAGMVNASWKYIAQIYKIRGARALFDLVGVHPYTHQPQGVITILENVRQVMNAAGDGRKPIVADEVGWTSSAGKSPDHFGIETTEAGQARNLAALLPMLQAARARLGLLGFDYYDWAGVEDQGGPEFDFAGLSRFSNGHFTTKPAFGVFRRDALAIERCRQKAAVATRCAKPG